MIWHSEPLDKVSKELQTDLQKGLSEEQVADRFREYGPNKLDEKPVQSLFRRFLARLKRTPILVLGGVLLLSLGLNIYGSLANGKGDWISPIVLFLLLLAGVWLGAFREGKVETAWAELKARALFDARVLRAEKWRTVKTTELVPGDIIEMKAGDLIPADCRLIETVSFQCDESVLTGKTPMAEKDAAAKALNISPLSDRLNMAYAGCTVVGGYARGVVTETGTRTERGKILGMLDGTEDLPMQQSKLAKWSRYLGYPVLVVCGILLLVGLLGGGGILSTCMTISALAVAVLPEGLEAILRFHLVAGAGRLAQKNTFVRRLRTVETLGDLSVICADKTGILTRSRMTLKQVYAGGHRIPLDEKVPTGVLALIRLAILCTEDTPETENDPSGGHSTDEAIVRYGSSVGMEREALMTEYPRLGGIPFDTDRKLMTTVNLIEEGKVVIVKGAPDVLLSRCATGELAAAARAVEEMGRDRLRVLAIGYKYIEDTPTDYRPEELEYGLTFAGLVGMAETPRTETIAAIRECDSAGIRTVMMTGDHVMTASALARELGILQEEGEVITGAQLAEMTEESLLENISRYRVYAQVSSADKLRIVNAWKKAGEVVAVTGSDVDDAPALRAADVGCGIETSGKDVAKEAADLLLTDNPFFAIVAAVKEGRRRFDNIRQTVSFLLSCKLGMLLVLFGSMLLWREGALLPTQILMAALLAENLLALSISMEPARKDTMLGSPRKREENLFARGRGWMMGGGGLFVGLISLIAYFLGSRGLAGLSFFPPIEEANRLLGGTMAFAVLTFSQIFLLFSARTPASLFRTGVHTNRYLIGASLISLVLMLAVLCIPGLQGLFGVVPMTGGQWGIVAGLSLVPLIGMEILKGIRAWIGKKR